MNIMTKQGSLDNVITYEHYCDTVADLQNIPKSQITLGSVAIVVNGESDGIEIYIADSHKQWTELTSMSGGSGDSSIYNLLHICVQDEYNSNTLIPTIEEPNDTTIYLVPGGSGNNLYQEWVYVNDNWEKFGVGNIALNAGDISFNNQEVYNSGTVGKEIGDLKSQTNTISTAAVTDVGKALSPKTVTNGKVTEWKFVSAGGAVTDVQINGTSVLGQDGVANVPVANNTLGLVKVGMYGTNGININKNDGTITVAPANLENIQRAELQNKPIASPNAYAAAFYGLAKAAGDTTQSQSSNAVGNYTNEAKNAIRNMLGVETTTMFVENVSGTTATITGEPNTRYVCGEVLSISITPPQTGTIDVFFTAGSTVPVLELPNTVIMPEWWTGVESGYTYEIVITDGVYGSVMAWPT